MEGRKKAKELLSGVTPPSIPSHLCEQHVEEEGDGGEDAKGDDGAPALEAGPDRRSDDEQRQGDAAEAHLEVPYDRGGGGPKRR